MEKRSGDQPVLGIFAAADKELVGRIVDEWISSRLVVMPVAAGEHPIAGAFPRQMMDLFTESIQGLTAVEKLRLIERIWDEVTAHEAPIPLPDGGVREAEGSSASPAV